MRVMLLKILLAFCIWMPKKFFKNYHPNFFSKKIYKVEYFIPNKLFRVIYIMQPSSLDFYRADLSSQMFQQISFKKVSSEMK